MTARLTHLDASTLLRLVTADLDTKETREARRHLSSCRACTRSLKETRRLDQGLKGVAMKNARQHSRPPAVPKEPHDVFVRRLVALSNQADVAAETISAASYVSLEEATKAIRALDGSPCRGLALLYACSRASPLVATDPKRALDLSMEISKEAETLPDAKLARRTKAAAARQHVQADAALFESQAQLQLGFATESREAVKRARVLFKESGDIGFGKALCDYYEGSAAGFSREYPAAEKLLKRALRTFAEFGQENLVGRAEAALGALLAQRGDYLRALQYLEHAIEAFDPARDSQHLTITLNNKADTLSRLGRFDDARATYARALNLARKRGYVGHLRYIRGGLAELDFRRGKYGRALHAFGELARESSAVGSPSDRVFARLYVAECFGRLGRINEMVIEIASLREDQKATPFSPSPASDELFACLDQGILDADLVGHVRRYLEDTENGIQRPYRRLRLVI